ncbi:polysaccharide deacetylase [Clostridiaceae bacterium HFYG-1003]|nr:polysaccharide deacetylase [Clostridiaceae bacterium HFYG-1003]
MKSQKMKILAFSLFFALAATGCTLTAGTVPTPGSTSGSPASVPVNPSNAPNITKPGVTQPATKPTTTPVTTTAAGSGQTPGTKPSTTTAGTTTAGSTTTNPINPSDIKSGEAYDTATVRDWTRNASQAAYYPKQKLVFLTFDDGPSTKVTPLVLDVLKKNNVKATFFYYTHGDLSSRAGIVRRTADEGHAIAIHTASHNYKKLYPGRKANVEAILSDVRTATSNIQAVLGASWKPSVYRFPGGSFSWTGSTSARKAMTQAKQALGNMGLQYLDWNAMTGDADYNNRDKSPSGLVKYAVKTTKNAYGHVIVLLMHDADHLPNTPKALQGLIDYYREQGYEFGILK